MRRLLVLAPVCLAAAPAAAIAAPTSGTYAGTSSGKYVQVGQAEEPTDKGTVKFKVQGGKVLNFRLRGQLMQCGPPNEVAVTVAKIQLDSSGKGSAVFQDPAVGALKVTIKVTSAGRASGSIRTPASAAGLCDPDYPVRFSARRT